MPILKQSNVIPSEDQQKINSLYVNCLKILVFHAFKSYLWITEVGDQSLTLKKKTH